MKPDMAEVQVVEEKEEAVLTPMQLAFQAARQQGQPAAAARTAKSNAKRDEHEDIFARTIQQHARQTVSIQKEPGLEARFFFARIQHFVRFSGGAAWRTTNRHPPRRRHLRLPSLRPRPHPLPSLRGLPLLLRHPLPLFLFFDLFQLFFNADDFLFLDLAVRETANS